MHPALPHIHTMYPISAVLNMFQQHQRHQPVSYELFQQQQQQRQQLQMLQMQYMQMQVNSSIGPDTGTTAPITPTKFNVALHLQQQQQQLQLQQQQLLLAQQAAALISVPGDLSGGVAANPLTILPTSFTSTNSSSNLVHNTYKSTTMNNAPAAMRALTLSNVDPRIMSMATAPTVAANLPSGGSSLTGMLLSHYRPISTNSDYLINPQDCISAIPPVLAASFVSVHPGEGVGLLGSSPAAKVTFLSSESAIQQSVINNQEPCTRLFSNDCSSASSDCSMLSPSLSHLASPQKRGSDELLSQAAVMAPASDNNNQDLATKKAKLEPGTVLGGVGKPSKVIHLRNIPNESSDADVIALGVPFGRVTNVLVLKGKNQAFLEMADEVSATSMVSCYTVNPPQMRGRMVYVQFSNHRELKTDQNHGNAIQSDYRMQSPVSGSPLPICGGTNNTTLSSSAADTAGTVAVYNSTIANNTTSGSSNNPGGPNTVLRVIVESQLYPVSLDILHQIFQRFGKVLKIVTFTKNNTFQALIQYPDAHSAQHAKTILDGQNIYNGCCTLRIDNSKMTTLNVKYNNDKSRDFTNPSLPPGEPGADIMPTAGGLVNANDLLLLAARQRPSLTGDKIVNGLGAPGVLPPFALGIGTPLTGGYNSGITNLGAFALANSGALQTTTPALRGFSNVLLVSNLNEEMVTPDALFTLFGVYGDVQRVKILYNKKDSALIQMAEPQQAYLAMNHLDKLRLWGKAIRVMASKHQAVQLPKEGQPDAGLTRDYSQNPLHRFKKPGSKNYQNIYPPSATLHLSNIPSSCTEEDIKEAFTSNNFEVKAFKFFPKDRKMALLQLSSVEEAVLALIKMHNHQLSESNHLRVSFSKSNI